MKMLPVLLAIATFLGCRDTIVQSPNNLSSHSPSSNITGDTIVKDIPVIPGTRTPLPFYFSKLYIEESLRLEKLENGFDSLEVRIWLGYLQTDTAQLITIKRLPKSYEARIRTILYKTNKDDNSKLEVSVLNEYVKFPRSGWLKFFELFLRSGVLELPDVQNIPNYPQFTHASAVVIEVGTSKKYRIFKYAEPKIAANNGIAEAKSLWNLLQFLRMQFDYDFIGYHDNR